MGLHTVDLEYCSVTISGSIAHSAAKKDNIEIDILDIGRKQPVPGIGVLQLARNDLAQSAATKQ